MFSVAYFFSTGCARGPPAENTTKSGIVGNTWERAGWGVAELVSAMFCLCSFVSELICPQELRGRQRGPF